MMKARSASTLLLVFCLLITNGNVSASPTRTTLENSVTTETAQPEYENASVNDATTLRSSNIYVGIYLRDISAFDLKEGRFKADLDIWMKWLGPEEIEPLRFANAELQSMKEISRESDGNWRSRRWRAQGTFRGTFPLHDFPFDVQQLNIGFEYPIDGRTLKPDLAGSGVASQFSTTGWIFEPYFRVDSEQSTHHSDFGSIRNEGKPLQVQQLGFVLDLSRPFVSYIVKFIIPLAIIFLMACIVFWVAPSSLEVRTSVGITALLSCIAFHFTQSDSLPNVPYLVSADHLFLGSYTLILSSLIVSVTASNTLESHPNFTRRFDRACRIVFPLLAIVGCAQIFSKGDVESIETPKMVADPLYPKDKEKLISEKETLVVNRLMETRSITGLSYLPLIERIKKKNGDWLKRSRFLHTIPSPSNEYVRFLPDGGMTVEWRLKSNLKWGDGKPFTSSDLQFSLEANQNIDPVQIKRVDDTSVLVRWPDRKKAYLNSFPVYPKHQLASVMQQGGYGEVLNRMRDNPPPNNGPFNYVGSNDDGYRIFERNPHFAGPPSAAKTIKVCSNLREPCYKYYDRVDLLASVSEYTTKRKYEPMGKWITQRINRAGSGVMYLDVADDNPFLAELDVRRGIMHAIDRARLNEIFHGNIIGGVAHRLNQTARVEVTQFAYDPALAKALIKPHLSKLSGPLIFDVPKQAKGPYKAFADIVVENLTSIGLEIDRREWKVTEFRDVNNMLRDFPGLKFKWHEEFDHSTCAQPQFWGVPIIDGVAQTQTLKSRYPEFARTRFAKLAVSLFPERRKMIDAELEKKFFEILPTLPMIWGGANGLTVPSFRGWKPNRSLHLFWNAGSWRTVAANNGKASELD